MTERQTEDLQRAYEALRRVQLTLNELGPEGEAEEALSVEALTGVIRDLETVMSDHFDMYVEA